jgi:hypothetical protein
MDACRCGPLAWLATAGPTSLAAGLGTALSSSGRRVAGRTAQVATSTTIAFGYGVVISLRTGDDVAEAVSARTHHAGACGCVGGGTVTARRARRRSVRRHLSVSGPRPDGNRQPCASLLKGFRKLPLPVPACRGHLLFWFGILPTVVAIHKGAGLEQPAMASPPSYWAMAESLGRAAFVARRITNASANRSGPEIQFEESASGELVVLDLEGLA